MPALEGDKLMHATKPSHDLEIIRNFEIARPLNPYEAKLSALSFSMCALLFNKAMAESLQDGNIDDALRLLEASSNCTIRTIGYLIQE